MKKEQFIEEILNAVSPLGFSIFNNINKLGCTHYYLTDGLNVCEFTDIDPDYKYFYLSPLFLYKDEICIYLSPESHVLINIFEVNKKDVDTVLSESITLRDYIFKQM